MTWMLRNSRGRRDALLTFSAGAVATVLGKTLLNGVSITVAGVTVSGGAIDAAIIWAVLGPTLATYTSKRIFGAKDEPGAGGQQP